jgi:hypothetical protein
MPPRHALLPGVFVAVGLAILPASGQTVTATTVALAADRLHTYTTEIAGVVLEEKYLQQAQGRVVVARELESDLAVIGEPQFGWIEFRDVFAVDGEAVRDRQDRVIALFSSARADALEQAQRIVQEGARYNLNPVGVQFSRTINLPFAALMYLQSRNVSRSQFQRQSAESLHGRPVLLVRFEEQRMPRLIGSADNAPARGQFWIDRETGQVLRSVLSIESRRGTTTIEASIEVDYRFVDDLDLWLPRSMEETYNIFDGQGTVVASISGRALYSNYRKFRVEIDEGVAGDGLVQEQDARPPEP